ncbi:class I adenylate-forming enzyme family protein [Thiomonas sp.]
MITLQKIAAYAQAHPDKAAMIAGRHQISWIELRARTTNCISYLVTRQDGELPDQACYIADNRLDLIPWLAAFATLSIPVVGLDYTLPVSMLEDMARKIGADFMLISSQRLALPDELPDFGISQSSRGMLIDLDSLGSGYIDAIGSEAHSKRVLICPPTRPFRSVSFTSGTSGLPKVVLRNRSFDARRFQYFTDRYRFSKDDRFLVSMPLYHASGNGWARLFMSLGATLYLADGADDADLARQLEQHAITATVLSPVLLSNVLQHLHHKARPSSLRWVLVGGRNFTPVEKQHALERLGPIVHEYYGTTESGVNTVAEPWDLAHYPASVGRAFEGNDIAIIDTCGRRVDAGQAGIVCIASYMNMDGYLGSPAPFVTLDDGQRYFVTPDYGCLDEAGRLYLMNRAGDGAVQTPLYRLENALRQLPCIDDVALLQQGKAAACAYTLRTDVSDAARVRQRIAQVASDEQIELNGCRHLERIPYSPSGKVRVRDLAEALGVL